MKFENIGQKIDFFSGNQNSRVFIVDFNKNWLLNISPF